MKNKKILKISLKLIYLSSLLLIGYEVYNRVNVGTWQYFISVIIAWILIKTYTITNKIFNYITTNTIPYSTRTRHRL